MNYLEGKVYWISKIMIVAERKSLTAFPYSFP